MKCLFVCVLTVLTMSVMAQQSKNQARVSGEISYLISTPKDYSQTGTSSPLLLFLHGAGERGEDLNKVKKWGPPKFIEEGGDLPFIVVAPQCPSGKSWNVEILKKLLDDVIENNNVDQSRVYLTGLSMGGFGSFNLAIAYPDYFAAVAPICGGGNASMAYKMKDIPTWVFHGKLDKAVPYSQSVDMVKALEKAGAKPIFTTLDEGEHADAWIYAYNEAGLWGWFLKHKNN